MPMLKHDYTHKQKRRASTLLSLSLSELEASDTLVEKELFREALVHMYFCCFYVSQALLVKQIGTKPSHKNLEAQLHKTYGKSKAFPRRYVDIHTTLHALRNQFNYNATHSPQPTIVIRKLAVLRAYVAFAMKAVPKIETAEILSAILAENPDDIREFSYDIYCPKTYAHHTRLTLWQPPFYLDIFSAGQVEVQTRRLLKNLRVARPNDYVVGINSRLDQYGGSHLIMLDIDSLAARGTSARF